MLELPDHHFPCQLFLYAGHLYDLNLPFVRSCPSIPLLFSYGILHTLHLRDNNNSYIKTCTNALIFVDFIYISPYNYKANKKYVSVYKIYTGFEGKKRTIDEAPYPNLTVYLFKLHRLPYFAPTAAPCCWRPANTASGVLGCMASIILDSVKK